MENLRKALNERLEKAKYLSKKRGKNGKWEYKYSDIKGGKKPTKEQKKEVKKFKGDPTSQHFEHKQIREDLKQAPKNVSKNALATVAAAMKKDKATVDYHWLRGYMGSTDKEAKDMYNEMIKRGAIDRRVSEEEKESKVVEAAELFKFLESQSMSALKEAAVDMEISGVKGKRISHADLVEKISEEYDASELQDIKDTYFSE